MKHALIIKIGAIGDAVMALPILPTLAAEGYESVSWLAGNDIAGVIDLIPEINNRLYLDQRALFGSKFAAIKEVLRTWWKLKGVKADDIYVLHGDSKYKALIPPWLWSARVHQARSRTRRHHTFDYARLAVPQLEDHELSFAPYVLPLTGKVRIPKTVCLFPGGAKNAMRDDPLRRWPLENYVGLVKLLLQDGWKVSIGGGPSDTWIEPAFSELKSSLDWKIGKLKIRETIEDLATMQLAISHDTGPIHLASLADCPIITLFGPTLAATVAPLKFLDMAMELSPKLACQPCYDGRDYGNCSNNICLAKISPAQVFEKVTAFSQKA